MAGQDIRTSIYLLFLATMVIACEHGEFLGGKYEHDVSYGTRKEQYSWERR